MELGIAIKLKLLGYFNMRITNFEKDIFITEKVINPITTLQPFILFGACGYLKYFLNTLVAAIDPLNLPDLVARLRQMAGLEYQLRACHSSGVKV